MNESTPPPADASPACSACEACPNRRDFVRWSIAAAAALALLPRNLRASPPRWITSRDGAGNLRYPVPSADGVEIDRSNEVILARTEGQIAAFALSCPHQRSMLRWRENDGIFQCTKHHSEYSPAGVYQKGRATRNMDRLAIRLEAGEVVVDPDTRFLSDDDPEGWAGAVVPVP